MILDYCLTFATENIFSSELIRNIMYVLGGHSKRVAKVAASIAKLKKLEKGEIACIYIVGLLHGVRKIAISTLYLDVKKNFGGELASYWLLDIGLRWKS